MVLLTSFCSTHSKPQQTTNTLSHAKSQPLQRVPAPSTMESTSYNVTATAMTPIGSQKAECIGNSRAAHCDAHAPSAIAEQQPQQREEQEQKHPGSERQEQMPRPAEANPPQHGASADTPLDVAAAELEACGPGLWVLFLRNFQTAVPRPALLQRGDGAPLPSVDAEVVQRRTVHALGQTLAAAKDEPSEAQWAAASERLMAIVSGGAASLLLRLWRMSITQGLHLAGETLQAPRFHPVDWVEGQRFSLEDDPDRCQQVWEGVDFFRTRDPQQQALRTTVQELGLECGLFDGADKESFARVVHGVLEAADCAALLASINAKGFTPALLNTGRGRQEFLPKYRLSNRVIVDSPEFANWLLQVLRQYLPASFETWGGETLVDINERCRFLCYTPGQQFEEHCDGCYTRGPPHPHAGDQSRVTIQLYLHDIPAEHGGATTLYPSDPEFRTPVQPKMGSALLFTQNLPHEGSLVTAGIKYTMRTEVSTGIDCIKVSRGVHACIHPSHSYLPPY